MHHLLKATDRLLSALTRRRILPGSLSRLRFKLLRYAAARTQRRLRRAVRHAIGFRP